MVDGETKSGSRFCQASALAVASSQSFCLRLSRFGLGKVNPQTIGFGTVPCPDRRIWLNRTFHQAPNVTMNPLLPCWWLESGDQQVGWNS